MAKNTMLLALASGFLGLCDYLALPAAAQTVGDPQVVTYGPWNKVVNEPVVAAFDEDRVVVLWNISAQEAGTEYDTAISVDYALWDSTQEVWGAYSILPAPEGSVAQFSPFVTRSPKTTDEFIAGAISIDSSGDRTAYIVHMPANEDAFDPDTLVEFPGCDVDYAGIGSGIGGVPGSSYRTAVLQTVLAGGGGCGEDLQLAVRDSDHANDDWDDHEPIVEDSTNVLGFASPPRIPHVGRTMYFSYSTLQGDFVKAISDDYGQGGNLDPVDLGLDETRDLSASGSDTY